MNASPGVGAASVSSETPVLAGALPAHMIDLIRDGVTRDALRKKGHGAVYNALVRTACSAQQRGWTYSRWHELVDDPVTSVLALQNHRDGRGGRRTDRARNNTLVKAWEAAVKWVAEADPPWTKEVAADRAKLLAMEVRAFVGADDDVLTHEEALVLDCAADAADNLGSDRMTISVAKWRAGTELGLSALRTALRRLEERRALVLEVRGEPRSKGKRPRANVYRLHPVSQWENPVNGAPTFVSDAPGPDAPTVSGAPPGAVTLDQVAAALGEEAARLLQVHLEGTDRPRPTQ